MLVSAPSPGQRLRLSVGYSSHNCCLSDNQISCNIASPLVTGASRMSNSFHPDSSLKRLEYLCIDQEPRLIRHVHFDVGV